MEGEDSDSSSSSGSLRSSPIFQSNFHEVIVVGAGLSGLSTATNLIKKYGVHDVVVFEAKNYVGGRVKADVLKFENSEVSVNLGANWIHGKDGNPIAKIANEIGMVGVPTTEGLEKIASLACFDDCPVTEGELEAAQQIHFDTMNKLYQEIDEASDDEEDQSMAVALCDALQEDPRFVTLDEVQHRVLGYLRARDEEFVGSGYEFTSYLSFNDDEDFAGDQLSMQNMSMLVDHLARSIDIRLSHIVRKVEYNFKGVEPGRVRVTLEGGAVHTANVVVLALPISQLQRRFASIVFEPSLPVPKIESIERIRFGTLNKVFLSFRRAFWDDSSSGLPASVVGKEYISYVRDFASPVCNLHESNVVPVHFINLNKIHGKPALCAAVYGNVSDEMEHLSDEAIKENILVVLRKMYGKFASAEDLVPVGYLITRWKSEPFINGSYSVFGLNCEGADLDCVAEPVCNDEGAPVLCFAGECTVKQYVGTIHAAYISGEREADRISAHLGRVALPVSTPVPVTADPFPKASDICAPLVQEKASLPAGFEQRVTAAMTF